MLVFTLGKPYPVHNRANGHEKMQAEIVEDGFFNVLCYLRHPRPAEVQAWRTQPIKYGMHEAGPGLPFILTEMAGMMFDVTLNLRPVGVDRSEAGEVWPEQESNRLTYFLIEACTNTLLGLRSFGAAEPFAEQVRAAVRRQFALYPSGAAVDTAFAAAEATPLQKMAKGTTFYLSR